MLERLGKPETKENGWYRLEWLDGEAGENAVAEAGEGDSVEAGGASRWKRAWHGSKLEGLYSILFHGRLLESRNNDMGQRFLEGAPGVYFHKDGTQQKAENYIRWVPLCQD